MGFQISGGAIVEIKSGSGFIVILKINLRYAIIIYIQFLKIKPVPGAYTEILGPLLGFTYTQYTIRTVPGAKIRSFQELLRRLGKIIDSALYLVGGCFGWRIRISACSICRSIPTSGPMLGEVSALSMTLIKRGI